MTHCGDPLHEHLLGDYYDEHELWTVDDDEPAEVEEDQDAVVTAVSDCLTRRQ